MKSAVRAVHEILWWVVGQKRVTLRTLHSGKEAILSRFQVTTSAYLLVLLIMLLCNDVVLQYCCSV
jgi:hypothetical protein